MMLTWTKSALIMFLTVPKKGDVLELSEAIRDHYEKVILPATIKGGSAEEFFLLTRPEFSGSPPSRAPPPVPVHTVPAAIVANLTKSQSLHSPPVQELTIDDIEDFDDEDDDAGLNELKVVRRQRNDASDLIFELPPFSTGITDDDLRETAYEVLLASVGATRGLSLPSKEKKKEKKSKLLRKLARSKSETVASQASHESGLAVLLEAIRVQMEISDAMDVRTRQGFLHALNGRIGKRMDTLLVPLELLCCISQADFSDKKSYLKWQKRQFNVLEEGLLHHPVVPYVESGHKPSDLTVLLAKIEESEVLPSSAGEIQRNECLRSLRDIALALAERPARGDLTGDVCHWADGYHLNVKLYEKLLFSVFDILDEGKLAEEAGAILELLKSTWRILGITETIHGTCYAWVLFRQFVVTGEQRLLQHATEMLRKIPLKEQRSMQEKLYLKGLRSSIEGEIGNQELTFMHSVLSPIKRWADKRLEDYHCHFSEHPGAMEGIASVAVLTRRLLVEEANQGRESDRDQVEGYISSSIKYAFTRVLRDVDDASEVTREHPLALLAEELRKLLKKESTMFSPILSCWHPQAVAISVSLLHRLYGGRLRPFLDGAEHLTEDVVSVFSAADNLERYMMGVVVTSCEDEMIDEFYKKKITPYQVESISGMLVMRWVNSQLGRILGWVERTIQQEKWEPLSPQQRHGSSIVEVYRIIEETVDQFFALKVPMRLTELNSLFRGLDNAFQVYTRNVVDQIGNKDDLIPPLPILTRYKKESGIKAFVKKELIDPRMPDHRRSSQINVLSTAKLCVQLNTLYYAISHLNKLEDNIRERWSSKAPQENLNAKRTIDDLSRSDLNNGQTDAFDGTRKDINAAIDKICEFTGTKIVFWDLRELFIDGLYKPTASQSRLEALIESFDGVLIQLCDIIMEPLRDRLVSGLLHASLAGLVRVLLDGGPLRIFFQSDARLFQEDLEILKEFFISGGDGLPRGKVENLAVRVQLVIKLHGLETRELIEDLKAISMQGNRSKLGTDTETLLRVLCHRADTEASQFLKKQYKIPSSSS
ncbi:protein unc-13 homolog isoform X2 [Nymphaea colorata]|uniref:protein unc-13 homolog isoform X2 n=1 Tax=Nymphaea colorata TaxID=210225 RepID=UPI00129EA004|nr:protein unc-13 homolog isoform X2 [Nymphaea colorata]